MNRWHINYFAINLLLAVILAALTGCVSQSYTKGAATSDALHSTAEVVAQTSTSVNGVLAALNNLTFKSQGDLRTQYDAFVSASKNLTASLGRLDSKFQVLQGAATNYINDWTNQLSLIQNDELRNLGKQRESRVKGRLDEATASYQNLISSLKPFISDLKDIQIYLGTDLTPGGLDTIKGIVAQTKVHTVPLRDALKNLQASFDALSTALSPVMPSTAQK